MASLNKVILIIVAALAICILEHLEQYTPDATGGTTTAADVGKPNGAKVIELTLEGIEPAMIDLLNGGVPEGAQAKHLVGSAGDVWQYQDHYYVSIRARQLRRANPSSARPLNRP